MNITANKTFLKRIIKYYNKYHFSCFTIKDIDRIEIEENHFNIVFNNSTKGQIYFCEIN